MWLTHGDTEENAMKIKPAVWFVKTVLSSAILLILSECQWAQEEINTGPVTDITVTANGSVVSGGITVNMGSEMTLTAVLTPPA
jgi:hypothetical protein